MVPHHLHLLTVMQYDIDPVLFAPSWTVMVDIVCMAFVSRGILGSRIFEALT
jgi:hypothetical protein